MPQVEKREFIRTETVKGISINLSRIEAAELHNILCGYATCKDIGNFTLREMAASIANGILKELQITHTHM